MSENKRLIDALIELSKIKELRATGFSSLKGGLITGAATVLGGLLLGKYGLLLGAAVGGGTSAALADDFKPVWNILRDLLYEKWKELISCVINAFSNIGIQEVAAIASLLLKNASLQQIAIQELIRFLQNEYNLRIAKTQKFA